MPQAKIQTLTNGDGSFIVYPRTTVEAVYGLENIDGRIEELETQLDGKVPSTRKVNGKELSSDITLSASDIGAASFSTATISIATSNWSSNTATISCSIVTASNTLIIAPAPTSYSNWGAFKVRATAQTAGKITFKCDTTPTAALSVNVVAIGA